MKYYATKESLGYLQKTLHDAISCVAQLRGEKEIIDNIDPSFADMDEDQKDEFFATMSEEQKNIVDDAVTQFTVNVGNVNDFPLIYDKVANTTIVTIDTGEKLPKDVYKRVAYRLEKQGHKHGIMKKLANGNIVPIREYTENKAVFNPPKFNFTARKVA